MTIQPHSQTHPLPSARSPLAGHAPAFTVIELLIVIGILSVVLAIIMPGIQAIRNATFRRQAQVEATALVQAAIRYKTEYGFWPGQLQPNNDPEGTVKLHNDIHDSVRNQGQTLPRIIYANTAFFNKYQCWDGSGDDITHRVLKLHSDTGLSDGRLLYQAFCTIGRVSAPIYPINPLNPKGIHFLDLKNEHDHRTVDYRDPWDQDYVLIMGLNPKAFDRYEIPGYNGPTIWHTVSNQIAFAFSLGPPNKHGTNLIYSAGVSP